MDNEIFVTSFIMFIPQKALSVFSVVAAITCLTACNGKSKPTTENFKAAIQASLDNQPGACVRSPSDAFPFDGPKLKHWGFDESDAAEALKGAGLLSSTDDKIALRGNKEEMVDGAHYTLTDEGKKYLVPAPAATVHPRFCGGKRKLRDLTGATPPIGDGVGSQVLVTYTYDIVEAPAWFNKAAIKKIFANDLIDVSKPAVGRARLELTKDGWSAPD